MPRKRSYNVELYHQLLEIFGEEGVSYLPSDRATYARDQWPRTLLEMQGGKVFEGPEFIVWPDTISEITKLLELANQKKFPVIPLGGGSGVTGGTIPGPKSVVLDLKKMNRILELNEQSLLVSVEAGILGEILERSLTAKGYTLGHFPDSMHASTLGGYLATRSAGMLSSKYGKIEDMAVSLLGVLPNGSVMRTRIAPRKATGPDLNQAMIGTEGTLGVIVQATLRIQKAPEAVAYRSYQFAELDAALLAMRSILQKGVRPSVCRLLEKRCAVETMKQIGFSLEPKGNLLIITTEGSSLLSEAEIELTDHICKEVGGNETGAELARHWWKHRFAGPFQQSSAFIKEKTFLDTIEVAASWKHIPALYKEMSRAIDAHATRYTQFLHPTTDGCSVSFTVQGKSGKSGGIEGYDKVWDAAMKACLKVGGTISHHQGIGLQKAQWLPEELGEGMRLYQELKHHLDPNNIMNPGKMGL